MYYTGLPRSNIRLQCDSGVIATCMQDGQDRLDEGQCIEVHDDDVYIETDIPEDTTRRHQQVPNHRDAVTRPGQSGLHGRTCIHATTVSLAHVALNDLLHFQSNA